MGIRFICQHCQKKLNVKSNQAGLAGQCPNCNGRIVVPKDSTIASELEKQLQVRVGKRQTQDSDDASIGLLVDEQVTMDGIPAEKRQQQIELVEAPAIAAPPVLSPEEESTDLFTLDKPQLPASMGKVDPIAQAPTRIWYFRSRELGEKGPLKSKVMQSYLDRGDVKTGCIVWRDDWHDWLPAETVFPKLAAHTKTETRKTKSSWSSGVSPTPENSPPLDRRERRKNQIFLAAVAAGIAIIIILLVVLLKLVSDNP